MNVYTENLFPLPILRTPHKKKSSILLSSNFWKQSSASKLLQRTNIFFLHLSLIYPWLEIFKCGWRCNIRKNYRLIPSFYSLRNGISSFPARSNDLRLAISLPFPKFFIYCAVFLVSYSCVGNNASGTR